MDKYLVGDIAVVNFPFSNLKRFKLRPALVVALGEFDNLILCQITSKPYTSKLAIGIFKENFAFGGLPIKSYIRPDKIFTANPSLIQKVAGRLTDQCRSKILTQVQALFIIK